MKRLFIFLLATVVLFIFSPSTFADMIVAWGNDEYDVVSNAPLSNDFTAITAGAFHGLALSEDSSFVSWYVSKFQRLEVFFKKYFWLFAGLMCTFVVIMFIRSLITGNWDFWQEEDSIDSWFKNWFGW